MSSRISQQSSSRPNLISSRSLICMQMIFCNIKRSPGDLGFWKLLRLHVCSFECIAVVPVNLQTTLGRLPTIFHFQLEIFPFRSYSDYLFPIQFVISFIFHTFCFLFVNCHFYLISLIIYIPADGTTVCRKLGSFMVKHFQPTVKIKCKKM